MFRQDDKKLNHQISAQDELSQEKNKKLKEKHERAVDYSAFFAHSFLCCRVSRQCKSIAFFKTWK